jgi:hypothetical protein
MTLNNASDQTKIDINRDPGRNARRDVRPTLVAAFEDRLSAERAIDELSQAGFANDQLGFVLRGDDVTAGGMITDAVGAKDAKGAVTGAATGAIVGGLAAAAVTALIPGVGPVLAAGTLAMFLGYAGAGAAIGGIFGALTGLGISEQEARYFEKAFHEGKALVAVKAGARAADAGQILTRNGGYDLQNRTDAHIQTGGVFGEP